MPSGNDTVQLLINVLGQEGIDQLVKSTANYKALLEDLAIKLKAGDISAEEFTRASARLSGEMEREERLLDKLRRATEAEAKAAEEAARALGHQEAAAKKVGKATEEVAKSSGSSARSLLELGRGIQDFQAAGLNGVVNNFEGLALALGLGSGVAGMATIAAVAIQSLMPQIKKLADSFSDEGAVAEAKAISALSEEADKLKEKLRELAGAHTERAKAMREDNLALERKIKLEEEARKNAEAAFKEETERQAKARAMERAPSLEEQRAMPAEKARAAELKKIIGGDPEAQAIREAAEAANSPDAATRYDAALRALGRERQRVEGSGASGAARTVRQIEREMKEFRAAQAAGKSPEEAIAALPPYLQEFARKAIGEREEAGHRDANRLLGQFYEGDPAALRGVIGLLPPGTLREGLERLTPQAQMGQRMKDIRGTLEGFARRVDDKTATEGAKRAKDAKEKRDKARKDQADAQARIIDEMSEHDAREAAKLEQAQQKKDEEKAKEKAKNDAKFFAARQRQKLAAEIREKTGLRLSPQEAAALAGSDLKLSDEEIGEARNARKLQRQVYSETGERITGAEAIQHLREQNRRLIQEQKGTFDVMLQSVKNVDQQIAMLKDFRARFEQELARQENTPAPSGRPR